MMGRRTFGALVLAGLAMTLSSCNSDTFGRTFEPYRIKVSAHVDTPQGVKSGHSVHEVTCSAAGEILGTQGGSICRVRGEAVVVDVAPDQPLFVLMTMPDGSEWSASSALPLDSDPFEGLDKMRGMEQLVAMKRAVKGVHIVPPTREAYPNKSDPPENNYPWFVRFTDINDPKSVEAVDPANLAKTYGKGVALKGLTVEVTDEPVTERIGKRLDPDFWKKWGSMHSEEMSKGPTGDRPYLTSLVGRLSRNDFIIGEAK